MQDNSKSGDRIKRRRFNGEGEEDLATVAAREPLLQPAAALAEGSNNPDLTALLLRQRLLAAEQHQNQVALQQQLARYNVNDSSASLLGADLLATGSGAPNEDAMVSHLRQNILNHQLQTRLQSSSDPLQSYLRGSETSPGSIYASLLGSTTATAGAPSATTNALLFQQALQRQQQGGSATDPSSLRAAAMAADPAVMRARLLGLDITSNNSASSILARLQNERAMLLGQAGLGPNALPPSALESFLQRNPAAGAAGMYSHQEMILASRGTAGGSFLGMPGPGGMHNPAAPTNATAASAGSAAAAPSNPNQTGRQPIHLYMSCDDDDLSPYQCLVRKQIELFEAQDVDAETNARGRNRPIVVGQVGIRCKWCKTLPPRKRERAAIYYPSKLDRLYQAGQTMASVHLGQHCNHIPTHIRAELARLREGKSAALAGKKYWSDGARALGVIEEDERLFFRQHES